MGTAAENFPRSAAKLSENSTFVDARSLFQEQNVVVVGGALWRHKNFGFTVKKSHFFGSRGGPQLFL